MSQIAERCQDGTFESTAALYEDYRVWCEQNGVYCAGRPKMRDVIMTYRPSVVATRRRITDAETGEVKLVWCLTGVRLRTPEDDLGEDAMPTDPVDPGLMSTPEPHEPHRDAICDGDPVDPKKVSEEARDESSRDDHVEGVFLPDDRITGSKMAVEVIYGAHHLADSATLLLSG